MKEKYSVTKTFLKGLMVILPVVVIVATILWLIQALESGLAWMFQWFLPERVYFPGLGVAGGFLLIYLFGLLMNTRAAQELFNYWERLLKRIPLIKSLYGSVQDIIRFFSSDSRKKFNRVVLVTFKDSDIKLVGFETQENISSLPQLPDVSDSVVVYLPMSYQIGGYMALVPRSSVTPINMSIEDASRLIFTAGMSSAANTTYAARSEASQQGPTRSA